MNERQFEILQETSQLILNKLEEIRCCVIDVESSILSYKVKATPKFTCPECRLQYTQWHNAMNCCR